MNYRWIFTAPLLLLSSVAFSNDVFIPKNFGPEIFWKVNCSFVKEGATKSLQVRKFKCGHNPYGLTVYNLEGKMSSGGFCDNYSMTTIPVQIDQQNSKLTFTKDGEPTDCFMDRQGPLDKPLNDVIPNLIQCSSNNQQIHYVSFGNEVINAQCSVDQGRKIESRVDSEFNSFLNDWEISPKN